MSRTFTLQDLQHLSLSALHTLRGTLHRELALAAPHSQQAREIFASLEHFRFNLDHTQRL
jgi:hypothetical protein